MRIPVRKISTAISFAIAASAAAQEALAQGAAPRAAGAVEEIAVTASRIVRDGYDSPTPQTVLSMTEIEHSADPALLNALSTIPALSGSQTNGVSHGRQGESLGGMQSINLRALGSN